MESPARRQQCRALVATPVIDRLCVTARCIEINYTWQVGAGWHAALTTLLYRLADDLGAALAGAGDAAASLRPFLAVRILGVISLRQMSGPHAVACLAKLAELGHPAWACPAGAPPSPGSTSARPDGGVVANRP